MYVQPHLQYTLKERVQFDVGSVFAWSTVPVRSPFVSHRNGGVALNHLGEESEGYQLGTELNWRISSTFALPQSSELLLYVEGAHLLPSSNLGIESPLSFLRVQTTFSWK